MAAVMQALKTITAGKGIVNDILAFAGGAMDGYCMKHGNEIVYLVKNIGVPVLSFLGVPIPEGLKHQCEGAIAQLIVFNLT